MPKRVNQKGELVHLSEPILPKNERHDGCRNQEGDAA